MGNALNAGNRNARVLFTVQGAVSRYTGSSKNRKRPPKRTSPRSTPPPGVEAAGLNPAHLGSTLEDFLKEEGMFETVHVLAVKKVVAYKLLEIMRQEKLTKDALAKRMKTSRAALDRLLDPTNPSVTLTTLGKAACALGRTLRIELIDATR